MKLLNWDIVADKAMRLEDRGADYDRQVRAAAVEQAGRHYLTDEDWGRIAAAFPDPPKPKGVGDHLHDVIFGALALHPTESCGCQSMRQQMNAWGVAGCVLHRAEIIIWLCGQAKDLSLSEQLRAAWKLKVPDPIRGADKMLDEAIRRCESDHVADAGNMVGGEAR